MPANYVLLQRIELNTTAASVVFSNIPQTGYTDLKVVVSARSTGASDWVTMAFNGNTSSYSNRHLQGNGSAASSFTQSTYEYAMINNQSGSTANVYSSSEVYIPNYTSSNFKSYSIDTAGEANITTAYMELNAQLWSNTAAITSITFTSLVGSLAANSTFSLYGLAALGTTPAIAPKATGGNIQSDGTYWYHTFLASGTFTPLTSLSCDVLQVAGGGGGGNGGGGAGAGGLLGFTSQSLAATAYTVTVGSGGAAGANGSNSQFASLTASVGGGGSSNSNNGAGSSGGSGGGGAGSNTGAGGGAGGAGTSGQGNAGGAGNNSNQAGGGGGAAAAGASANSGSAGGNGSAAYSSWGLATATGQNSSGTYYYAGGGGGYRGGGATSSGGLGGGGGSLSSGNGVAGTANTGGGAGGYSAAGGSGIIIVRYPIA